MEWIDIVDEFNQVVGCGTREFVHRQSLRHRSSHILLFNEQDEILLQQRSLSKDLFPGLWDSSVAGHLMVGESPLGGAYRECQEELGIIIEGLQLIGQWPATKQNDWEFTSLYKGIAANLEIHYAMDEVAAIRWLSLSQLDKWIEEEPQVFTATFLEIYNFYRQSGL